jgi:hypothetical protein
MNWQYSAQEETLLGSMHVEENGKEITAARGSSR